MNREERATLLVGYDKLLGPKPSALVIYWAWFVILPVAFVLLGLYWWLHG